MRACAAWIACCPVDVIAPPAPIAEAFDVLVEALPRHVTAMTKPLLRNAADLSWEQAIAMEEFAEPQCFTTGAHREAVEARCAALVAHAAHTGLGVGRPALNSFFDEWLYQPGRPAAGFCAGGGWTSTSR